MAEKDRDSQHVNDMLTNTATTSKELIQSIALNIPNATMLPSKRQSVSLVHEKTNFLEGFQFVLL